jgi:hypothetical protein
MTKVFAKLFMGNVSNSEMHCALSLDKGEPVCRSV